MGNSFDREKLLFEEALKIGSEAERAAFLNAACKNDPQLRSRLEARIGGHLKAEGSLQAPPAQDSVIVPTIIEGLALLEKPGDHIGRYKLVERIGEGGFGVVYMAEQEEPIKRQVALKIIKLGMDTRQVVARFEAERQALAVLDHPNVARIFDAGATRRGRPYFVMELIRGVPITKYCDQNDLSGSERLELVIQVCRAIQHAHQKGIIHRDIKPSNILVMPHDGVPVPKVIDFGVAKATQQELTEETLFTQFQQFIGTPAYMSPEQAGQSGLDIDTRSDIYGLGVLLYELLTGRTPFDAKTLVSAGLEEMRRIIREQEPVRPSTRLSTLSEAERTAVAGRRKSEPSRLVGLLRGDLDWIIMKCLEKDRTRRYETANGLAADLLRYLRNEAVTARPPSRAYRVGKFVRRNKGLVTAAMAVAGVLAVGLCASVTLYLREAKARQRLEGMVRNARTSSHLNDELRMLILSSAETGDIPKLFESLYPDPQNLFGSLRHGLLRRWGGRDPDAALAFAQAYVHSSVRYDFTLSALSGWADKDPQAALAWAKRSQAGLLRTRAINTALMALGNANPRAALDEFLRCGLPPGPSDVLQSIFAKWGYTDPAGGTAKVMALPDSAQREQAFVALASGWAERDPEAALGFFSKLPHPAARRTSTLAVLNAWCRQSPAAALGWVTAHESPTGRRELFETVVLGWAFRDFEGACAYVRQMPPGPDRDGAVTGMGQLWGENNPKSALEFADTLGANQVKEEFMVQVISKWAPADPASARDYLRTLPAGAYSERLVSMFALASARTDPKGAFEYIASLPDAPNRKNQLQTIAQQFARANLEQAAQAYGEMKPGPARDTLGREISWALIYGDDLRKAIAWIQHLPEGPERQEMLYSLSSSPRWGSDPQSSFELAETLPPGPPREQLLVQLGYKMAGFDRAKALEFLGRLPASTNRTAVVEGIAKAIAEVSLEEGISFVSTLTPAEGHDAALHRVLSPWIRSDPRSAAAWIQALPEAKTRKDALRSVVVGWANSDPSGVVQWLVSMPEGELRDDLVVTFIGPFGRKHPELGVRCLDTISKQGLRDIMTETIGREWLKKDRAAAERWLNGSSVSQEIRERLLGEPK